MIKQKTEKIKNDLYTKIDGVGLQFIEDITTILDHSPSNPYFIDLLNYGLVSEQLFCTFENGINVTK